MGSSRKTKYSKHSACRSNAVFLILIFEVIVFKVNCYRSSVSDRCAYIPHNATLSLNSVRLLNLPIRSPWNLSTLCFGEEHSDSSTVSFIYSRLWTLFLCGGPCHRSILPPYFHVRTACLLTDGKKKIIFLSLYFYLVNVNIKTIDVSIAS